MKVGGRYLIRRAGQPHDPIEIAVLQISPSGHIKYRNLLTGAVSWIPADEVSRIEVLEVFPDDEKEQHPSHRGDSFSPSVHRKIVREGDRTG